MYSTFVISYCSNQIVLWMEVLLLRSEEQHCPYFLFPSLPTSHSCTYPPTGLLARSLTHSLTTIQVYQIQHIQVDVGGGCLLVASCWVDTFCISLSTSLPPSFTHPLCSSESDPAYTNRFWRQVPACCMLCTWSLSIITEPKGSHCPSLPASVPPLSSLNHLIFHLPLCSSESDPAYMNRFWRRVSSCCMLLIPCVITELKGSRSPFSLPPSLAHWFTDWLSLIHSTLCSSESDPAHTSWSWRRVSTCCVLRSWPLCAVTEPEGSHRDAHPHTRHHRKGKTGAEHAKHTDG